MAPVESKHRRVGTRRGGRSALRYATNHYLVSLVSRALKSGAQTQTTTQPHTPNYHPLSLLSRLEGGERSVFALEEARAALNPRRRGFRPERNERATLVRSDTSGALQVSLGR